MSKKSNIDKIISSSRRLEEIESGFYSKPGHLVHKSAKDYNRKAKHKKKIFQ